MYVYIVITLCQKYGSISQLLVSLHKHTYNLNNDKHVYTYTFIFVGTFVSHQNNKDDNFTPLSLGARIHISQKS